MDNGRNENPTVTERGTDAPVVKLSVLLNGVIDGDSVDITAFADSGLVADLPGSVTISQGRAAVAADGMMRSTGSVSATAVQDGLRAVAVRTTDGTVVSFEADNADVTQPGMQVFPQLTDGVVDLTSADPRPEPLPTTGARILREKLRPNVVGVAEVTFEGAAELLAVKGNKVLDLYATVTPIGTGEVTTTLRFAVVRTGGAVPRDAGYVGTYRSAEGVVHVFQLDS